MVDEIGDEKLGRLIVALRHHFQARAHEIAMTEVKRARENGSPALTQWEHIAARLLD